MNNKHGSEFLVPLPDGSFVTGRVMLDIRACVKSRQFLPESPLLGVGKAHLVEMYNVTTCHPEPVRGEVLIAGAFVDSEAIGKEWPIVGQVDVDPKEVEFPESLIGFMHSDGECAFECGEISVPIPITQRQLFNEIKTLGIRHSSFVWPYACLLAMGRGDEVPEQYRHLRFDMDLRRSTFREMVYENLPFTMSESYFQKQSKMGLHLERLYG